METENKALCHVLGQKEQRAKEAQRKGLPMGGGRLVGNGDS